MKQATHFIEQVNINGYIVSYRAYGIHMLGWSLETSKKLNTPTIAIFKIYPKAKPKGKARNRAL